MYRNWNGLPNFMQYIHNWKGFSIEENFGGIRIYYFKKAFSSSLSRYLLYAYYFLDSFFGFSFHITHLYIKGAKVRLFLDSSCAILSSFKIVVIFNNTSAEIKKSQLMYYWKCPRFWICNCDLKTNKRTLFLFFFQKLPGGMQYFISRFRTICRISIVSNRSSK